MMLKLTQFAQTPATRSMVCSRCGYQMFWTKRFNWQCGPACDGAEQWHQNNDLAHMPQAYSLEKEDLVNTAKN
jgi:hypothetical protein